MYDKMMIGSALHNLDFVIQNLYFTSQIFGYVLHYKESVIQKYILPMRRGPFVDKGGGMSQMS